MQTEGFGFEERPGIHEDKAVSPISRSRSLARKKRKEKQVPLPSAMVAEGGERSSILLSKKIKVSEGPSPEKRRRLVSEEVTAWKTQEAFKTKLIEEEGSLWRQPHPHKVRASKGRGLGVSLQGIRAEEEGPLAETMRRRVRVLHSSKEGRETKELHEELVEQKIAQLSEQLQKVSLEEEQEAQSLLSPQLQHKVSLSSDMDIDLFPDSPIDEVMEIIEPDEIMTSFESTPQGDVEMAIVDSPLFDIEDIEMTGVDSPPPDTADIEMPPAEELSSPPMAGGIVEEASQGAPPLPLPVESEGLPREGLSFPPLPEPSGVREEVAQGPLVVNDYQRAQAFFDQGRYAKAYQLFLSLSRKQPGDRTLLLQTAACLEKMNRHRESLVIYMDLRRKNKDDLFLCTKIADILFEIGDYIRAQIIYKKLQTTEAASEEINRKISLCRQQLTMASSWSSFGQIFHDIGGADAAPLTPDQLRAVNRINRQLAQKNRLIWDLFFTQTRKLTPAALQKNFRKVALHAADGRTYVAYTHKDFRFLAHFTSPENAVKILEREGEAETRPEVREDPSYFWNCQYKVCTSLVQQGSKTFFSEAKKSVDVGLIIYAPDAYKNILHAYVKDSWTPSFVKSDQAKAVTSSGSEQAAQEYNAIMEKYQVLAEYVYAVWQNADREVRYLDAIEKLMDIEKLIAPQGLYQRLIGAVSSLVKVLTSWLTGAPGDNEAMLKKYIANLKGLCQKAGLGRGLEEKIFGQIAKIEEQLSEEGKEQQISKLEAASKELQASRALYPEVISEPEYFEQKKYLIIEYVDRTIERAQRLLQKYPGQEAAVFEKILGRKMGHGESLLRELSMMRDDLSRYVHIISPKVFKSPGRFLDQSIFCRPITPKEVSSGTKAYSEIGILTHQQSDAVRAGRASFKGVVVEQATVGRDGLIPDEVADALDRAQRAGLPIIYI
jgi:tetratricopeptide (TPR) repeat protein